MGRAIPAGTDMAWGTGRKPGNGLGRDVEVTGQPEHCMQDPRRRIRQGLASGSCLSNPHRDLLSTPPRLEVNVGFVVRC